MLDDSVRTIRYEFSPKLLNLTHIGTTLEFCVGPAPVPKFRMIERHYFGEKLMKSYDFEFGFCIPSSTNSWEAIYQMPELSEAEKRDIVSRPFESQSDSFYFVDDELVMHTKAKYAYTA